MNLITTLRALFTIGHGVVVGMEDVDESSDPIALFASWFASAEKSGIILPESAALATATARGHPSSRMVLLKSFDAAGFVFYTNYGSRKAVELSENPRAALLFHWSVLQRQIRIEGIAEKVHTDESDEYFASRGRGSQIGAWASRQSEQLRSRRHLENRVRETKKRFSGKGIPRPPHWGGFRLKPERIEFWQGRADRLHDRIVFTNRNGDWVSERTYP